MRGGVLLDSIGKRFRQLRKSKGLNQIDFAAAIGISQGTLSDIEKDKCKPSVETVISASGYFKVSCDWLLTGEEPVQKEQPPKYLPDKLGPLSEQEKEMLWKFRQLDARDQEYAKANIDMLYERTVKKGTSFGLTNGGTGEEAAASETA
ncbi:Transcriptional regulator, contains XRE-family HTH domain [Desulforamulus putei DSM 12395]|jgi:transcriptional regulator with XRE-family HTH domain|uniref:Transcriptional regulator, contains XRE-family HTH domain n=1 Tax=Desulforamulus putei DSM 12395 TaxID=1121429 RepID=A0A1M5C9Z9_9FIRM|nr:Transcriptional regulator, contains XRE-family HTH domain [Desulforamulus putei DSM 12395]